MLSGIYMIKNKINHKIYIGKSKNYKSRLNFHKSELKNGKHVNTYLQRAYNKYGKDNFSFDLLEECDIEFLCIRENYWCKLLKAHNREIGYNIEPTSDNCEKKFSEESRKKMSIWQKGTKRSEQYKITHSFYSNHLKKIVLQYNLSGDFIKEHECIRKAEKETNLYAGSIIACCKNKLNTCGNYIWRYKENDSFPLKIKSYKKLILVLNLNNNILFKSYIKTEIIKFLNCSKKTVNECIETGKIYKKSFIIKYEEQN